MLNASQLAALTLLDAAITTCAEQGIYVGAGMGLGLGLIEIAKTNNYQDSTLESADIIAFIEQEQTL